MGHSPVFGLLEQRIDGLITNMPIEANQTAIPVSVDRFTQDLFRLFHVSRINQTAHMNSRQHRISAFLPGQARPDLSTGIRTGV